MHFLPLRMRSHLFGFFLLCFGSAVAQYHLPEETEWFQYDLTHEAILNPIEGLSNQWYSNASQFSFLGEKLLGTSHFSLALGLGYSTRNYHTNLQLIQQPGTDQSYQLIPDTVSYSQNKFTTSAIEVPFELRYRSSLNKRGRYYRVTLGCKVGYRLRSYAEYQEGDFHAKYYTLNDMNLWQGTVYVRLGRGFLSAYAGYQFTSIFATGKVDELSLTEMNTLSMGLSISL